MNFAVAGAGLLATLTIASIVCLIWMSMSESPEVRNVWRRIKSWWIISAVLFSALTLGRPAIGALFIALTIFALIEYAGLLKLKKSDVAFYLPLVVGLQIAMFYYVAPVAILIGLGLSWIGLLSGRKHAGQIYLTLGLGAVASLVSSQAVFYLLFITGANDVFQYLVGKTFGGPKIAARISPAKTWSGALGGLVLTGALSALMTPSLLGLDTLTGFTMGSALSAIGLIGDLTISVVKRRARVAVTGSLLPGHGGLLDRVDSLCLSAPFFLFVFQRGLS